MVAQMKNEQLKNRVSSCVSVSIEFINISLDSRAPVPGQPKAALSRNVPATKSENYFLFAVRCLLCAAGMGKLTFRPVVVVVF